MRRKPMSDKQVRARLAEIERELEALHMDTTGRAVPRQAYEDHDLVAWAAHSAFICAAMNGIRSLVAQLQEYMGNAMYKEKGANKWN